MHPLHVEGMRLGGNPIGSRGTLGRYSIGGLQEESWMRGKEERPQEEWFVRCSWCGAGLKAPVFL